MEGGGVFDTPRFFLSRYCPAVGQIGSPPSSSSASFMFWFHPQALMDEILMLQEEIGELQTCFSEELADDDGDQLALQSTLTVLGERMVTIRMKASGKRQLLEVPVLPLSYTIFLEIVAYPFIYIFIYFPDLLSAAGETERAVGGAAAGAGAAALPQRGRGAGPLAAQHAGHPQLCPPASEGGHGHGGAAHRLSGQTSVPRLVEDRRDSFTLRDVFPQPIQEQLWGL